MASELRPPQQFEFVGDLANKWSTWKEQFSWYLKATKKDKEDQVVQVGILITLLGSEGLRIYKTFAWTDPDDATVLTEVIKKFDSHFQPRKSQTYERYKFFTRRQNPGESCDAFLLELQSLIATCDFGTQRDSILRDFLTIGVADNKTREKMLYEPLLTLEKAIEIMRACETSTLLADQMKTEAVNATQHKSQSNSSQGTSSGSQERQESYEIKNCRFCGESHKKGKCPAYGKECAKCGRKNHLEKVCRSGKKSGNVHSLTSGSTLEDFVVSSLETNRDSQWLIKLGVNGRQVSFKIDTGASCNVLPWNVYRQVCKNPLQPGPTVRNYSGQLLRVMGKQLLPVTLKGKQYELMFVVIEETEIPILGLPSCQELCVVERLDEAKVDKPDQEPCVSHLPQSFKHYMDVFQGIGKLPKCHSIRIKQEYTPVVRPARRLPFKIRDQVKAKLDQMEQLQLICKVVEPTEWVSPMVVVQKPGGDVRICLDPLDLNKAVQRQHYPVPTAQELFARIGKAKYFSTLDATSGFLQVPLTEDSSYVTTFATPFGRYRYLRLPFGICSAPEVYQQLMEELFGDLEGVEIYFDDFFVWGETLEQHNDRLKAVFERCRKVNLRLNLSKSRFLLPELPWIGHVIAYQQLRADPDKVAAIQAFKAPESKDDLQRLLGMINYLAKFCQNLSVITSPLRDLLKRDVEWTWDQSHMQIFETIKKTIADVPVLRLFNPSEPVMLSVDASPYGVGAVLLQAGQPIEFASRTLTETQRRYAQIEKELLAVQFGLQHFHHYVYGQRVQVETDHKPLLGLVDKPIGLCTPRIQRMRLQMQPYDFCLSYKPGKEMYLADTLSRAPEPREYSSDTSQQPDEQVNALLSYIIPEQSSRDKYVKATQDDPTLQLVLRLVEKGWPDHKKDCPTSAKPYWSIRSELSSANGLLLKREKIVVPFSLRPEMLLKIHDGHFGETKCVERAKSTVYWPGYTEQVRNLVAGCGICQERRNQNAAQPLYPVKLPDYPFQKVGADLFELQRRDYLLVVDYYSKWPCVVPLRSLTSATTIDELDRIFADFGIPEYLISDNGPQFGSAEFRAFAKKLGVSHSTSSPEYPESNGMAERTVQTVKNTLIKSMEDGKTLYDSLRAIRSTPVGDGLPSPAVLLQARNIRGSLPFLSETLQHRQLDTKIIQESLQRKQTGASFHQSGAAQHPVPELVVGQRVRVRVGKRWIPGAIKLVCQQPNSFVVNTDDGREFRRNRRAINIARNYNPALLASELPRPSPVIGTSSRSSVPQFLFPALPTSFSDSNVLLGGVAPQPVAVVTVDTAPPAVDASGDGGALPAIVNGPDVPTPSIFPISTTSASGEDNSASATTTNLSDLGGVIPPMAGEADVTLLSTSGLMDTGVATPPVQGEIPSALPKLPIAPAAVDSTTQPATRRSRKEYPPSQRSSERIRSKSAVGYKEARDKKSSRFKN